MSDTTLRECIICGEEKDCIQGICEECSDTWKVDFIRRYGNPDGTVCGIAGEMIAWIEINYQGNSLPKGAFRIDSPDDL